MATPAHAASSQFTVLFAGGVSAMSAMDGSPNDWGWNKPTLLFQWRRAVQVQLPCRCRSISALSLKEALVRGAEVITDYGQDACNVGDEGGLASSVQSNDEALDVLLKAIQKSGHADNISWNCFAALVFWQADKKTYDLDFRTREHHHR